jgi:hypothetical protein
VYFALPFIFSSPKDQIDFPSCIFVLLLSLARSLVVAVKYAYYGASDDWRTDEWRYTSRTGTVCVCL